MAIELPKSILAAAGTGIQTVVKKFFKNGIELEKGAVLTEQRIDKHRELYEQVCQFWSVYPDVYLDSILPSTSHFSLYFYQRIFLRVIMRHGRICVIAPRALITRRSIKSFN